VGGLDLTAVVDDFASGVNQGLGEVKSGVVDLREAKRDIAANCKYCRYPKY
jgi:hypothetical protein